MTAVIENGPSRVLMRTLEVMPSGQCQGDFKLEVECVHDGFQGSAKSIWIAKPDYDKFIKQLHEITSARRGLARFESMSPEEFFLEIYPTDQLGHYSARGILSKVAITQPDEHRRSRIWFDIELDPTHLNSLLTMLEQLGEMSA